MIDTIVNTYEAKDQLIVEQWLAVIYRGMIAEENKLKARLKKRIKRLGMHQILKLGMSPADAAKFSNGKKWHVLDVLMKSYNF